MITMIASAREGSTDTTEPVYSLDTHAQPDGHGILSAHGELDMTARVDIVHNLYRLAAESASVTVDLTDVTFMYSGVANALIDAARTGDIAITIVAPSRAVRMVLTVLGAGDLLVDRHR